MRSEFRTCLIRRKAVLLLHEESISEFGGARGLRDESLLESALARPRNIYAYNNAATIAELAAAYCYGVARNHAFMDGNKRAAFLCIGLFLAINGYRLTASQVDALETMLGVAAGTVSEPQLALWIAQNISQR